MFAASDLKALRTAIPYIRAYKGQVFVIKLGGQLCEPGPLLENLIDQLALLYQLGIRLVLVHGGGDQASALARRLGLETQIVNGRRVTDDATLETVKMAFAGTVNTNLLAALRRAHVSAVGLSGVDGGLVQARRRPPQTITENGTTREVDFGFVGDVLDVRPGVLQQLLDGQCLPVVCSLAADDQGQVYNVNADTIAAGIAVALRAAKYFLVTAVDGVLRNLSDSTTLLPYLDLTDLDQLTSSGAISGGMLPKLAGCRTALLGGVPRVHIVNGRVADTLLAEIFTNAGCGTLIVRQKDRSADEPSEEPRGASVCT